VIVRRNRNRKKPMTITITITSNDDALADHNPKPKTRYPIPQKPMYPLPTTCHVCGYKYHITKVQCANCQTEVSGQFALGRLHQLSAEQLDFVELFVACEGKINRVEQELNLSYTAVRARLHEVIRALGREVGEATDTPEAPAPPAPPKQEGLTAEQRLKILAQVAAGELNADEAAQRLRQS
jgi:hypothetical protein